MLAFKIVIAVCFLAPCKSANILYVASFTSKSHDIMLKPIGLELARRGHNVTVITAYEEENTPQNYHQVIMNDKRFIWDVLGIERPNVFDMAQIPAEEFHNMILWNGGVGITEMILNSSGVQRFLAKDNSFDLVISEQFFVEAFYLLAPKYNAPLVLVSTFGNCMRHNIVARNPLQLATTIQEFLDIKEPTSFWGRSRNVYFSLYEYIYWRFWYLDRQETLARKFIPHLPEKVPSLYEMQRNTALILLNSHHSFDPPTAYLPNIVEIGGIHLSKSHSALPQDLQKLLDDAKNGVVYMSFGSNVQSNELPVEKRDAFLNVFRKLKQQVFWKWEDDYLPNKPDNLLVRKWLPQNEILGHPNIKVFISHGGLIGTQEAIFHGVPIIGIPVYADQYNNLLQVQSHGAGRILQFNDINEQSLEKILTEVIRDNTYKRNAVELSERFKDRPISAMDSAMYWIEYVIRYKGAEHLKNPALELSWVAYSMLDVYAFAFACIALFAYVLYKLIKFLKSNLDNFKYNKGKKKQH